MIINGVELEFNYSSIGDMERFERAFNKCSCEFGKAGNMRKTGKFEDAIAAMRHQIKSIRELFDVSVGDGASDKVFGDSDDTVIYLKALMDFAAWIQDKMIEDNDAAKEAADTMREKFIRFSPQK